MHQIGKLLIFAGLFMLVAGLIFFFSGEKLHWIGRLPGDIRVEKENFRFYFPVTTMILLSIIVSVLLHIFRRFF